MSSVSSMLPMLLVIGLAVVAFMKRCDFLPELCNPSQQASVIPPATITGQPLLTWEDYKKAGKERERDDERDEETRDAADKIARINANRKQYSSVSAPVVINSGQNIKKTTSSTIPLSIPGVWGARFSRVAYF